MGHAGKRRHLGRFVEEEAAARAVRQAEQAREEGKLGEHLELKREIRRSTNTSRHKGVSWNKKHRKWETHITFAGKQHYLGSYSDEDAAAGIVRDAERRRENNTLAEYLIEKKSRKTRRKKKTTRAVEFPVVRRAS